MDLKARTSDKLTAFSTAKYLRDFGHGKKQLGLSQRVRSSFIPENFIPSRSANSLAAQRMTPELKRLVVSFRLIS